MEARSMDLQARLHTQICLCILCELVQVVNHGKFPLFAGVNGAKGHVSHHLLWKIAQLGNNLSFAKLQNGNKDLRKAFWRSHFVDSHQDTLPFPELELLSKLIHPHWMLHETFLPLSEEGGETKLTDKSGPQEGLHLCSLSQAASQYECGYLDCFWSPRARGFNGVIDWESRCWPESVNEVHTCGGKDSGARGIRTGFFRNPLATQANKSQKNCASP